MGNDDKKPYSHYKKELDQTFKTEHKYLREREDSRQEILINFRKKIGYDLTDDRKKHSDELADDFETHICDHYGLNKDADKKVKNALMKQYVGMDRKDIKKILSGNSNPEDVYRRLDQQIQQANQQTRQTHFQTIADDYVDINKPETLDHIIKYLKLEKHDLFDADLARRQPDMLKRLFMVNGVEGRITSQYIGEEMKKQVKPKVKKKGAKK
jgi:hypothetical protein